MGIKVCQSRKHLTGNAFARLDGYSDTEKSYTFIPCEIAFTAFHGVEVQKSVANPLKLQVEFR